jgi:hypothetical protein
MKDKLFTNFLMVKINILVSKVSLKKLNLSGNNYLFKSFKKKFKPLKVWQKYTTKKVDGKSFDRKHFITEETPK